MRFCQIFLNEKPGSIKLFQIYSWLILNSYEIINIIETHFQLPEVFK
jgi:hypothetical protein